MEQLSQIGGPKLTLYVAVSGLGAGMFDPAFAYVARLVGADNELLWSNYEPGLERRPDVAEGNSSKAPYAAILAALSSGVIPLGASVWLIDKTGSELHWVFGQDRPNRHRKAGRKRGGELQTNHEQIREVETGLAALGCKMLCRAPQSAEEEEWLADTRDAAKAAKDDFIAIRESERNTFVA